MDKVDTEKVNTDKVNTDEVNTDEVDTDEMNTDKVDTDKTNTDKVDTDEVDMYITDDNGEICGCFVALSNTTQAIDFWSTVTVLHRELVYEARRHLGNGMYIYMYMYFMYIHMGKYVDVLWL